MVDSYEGQVYDTVIQVIEDANKNLFEGSRKKYILTELLRANHKVGKKEEIKKELKRILSNYTDMTPRIKDELTSLGFKVEKAGKHYKIYFDNCDKFFCTLSCSGSDYRGGKNTFSDLKKKLL